MFTRTISGALIVLVLLALFGGASVYVKGKFDQHKAESAQFAENEQMLLASNKQLADKAANATRIAERSMKLRTDSEKRTQAARKDGCAELDDLIPQCIAELRHSNYVDYMKSRATIEVDK